MISTFKLGEREEKRVWRGEYRKGEKKRMRIIRERRKGQRTGMTLILTQFQLD